MGRQYAPCLHIHSTACKWKSTTENSKNYNKINNNATEEKKRKNKIWTENITWGMRNPMNIKSLFSIHRCYWFDDFVLFHFIQKFSNNTFYSYRFHSYSVFCSDFFAFSQFCVSLHFRKQKNTKIIVQLENANNNLSCMHMMLVPLDSIRPRRKLHVLMFIICSVKLLLLFGYLFENM